VGVKGIIGEEGGCTVDYTNLVAVVDYVTVV